MHDISSLYRVDATLWVRVSAPPLTINNGIAEGAESSLSSNSTNCYLQIAIGNIAIGQPILHANIRCIKCYYVRTKCIKFDKETNLILIAIATSSPTHRFARLPIQQAITEVAGDPIRVLNQSTVYCKTSKIKSEFIMTDIIQTAVIRTALKMDAGVPASE